MRVVVEDRFSVNVLLDGQTIEGETNWVRHGGPLATLSSCTPQSSPRPKGDIHSLCVLCSRSLCVVGAGVLPGAIQRQGYAVLGLCEELGKLLLRAVKRAVSRSLVVPPSSQNQPTMATNHPLHLLPCTVAVQCQFLSN